MATIAINTHICKGVRNKNSGDIMTMWKTQFNMPVPSNLFTSTPTYTYTDGPFEFYGAGTSFDLSGFEVGMETLLGVACLEITGPFPSGGYLQIQVTWRNPYGNIQFNQGGYSFIVYIYPPALSAGQKTGYFFLTNQGVESYEFGYSGTHTHEVVITGSASASQTTSFTMSNVPDTTNVASGAGYIWVEGNNLCYASYQYDKHSIAGQNLGYVGTALVGKFWVEGEDVAWVGSDGSKYTSGYSLYTKEKRSMRQVPSLFSNGPTTTVNAGTGNAGKIWMDAEFGHQHIAYISASGYKNLLYSGNYPWVAP